MYTSKHYHHSQRILCEQLKELTLLKLSLIVLYSKFHPREQENDYTQTNKYVHDPVYLNYSTKNTQLSK